VKTVIGMKQYYKQLILLKLYSLVRRLMPFISRIFLLFEPFIPFFVLLLLRRTLRNLESEGTIDAYFIDIVRVSSFHYTVEVRFVLTVDQIGSLLFDLLNKMFRSLKNE
jgi:hypothetical protein